MSNDTSSGLTSKNYARAKQAAQHFQIGKSTLWLWTKTLHDFPKPIKVGRRVTLFDIDAIEAYFKSRQG